MSASSPITETTLFLYSAITSTKCKIDFVAVGAALNLQSGTAAMRYRRLTERIKKSNAPAKGNDLDENSVFLYQCMVASKCKPDWTIVGVATGLKPGTASMRWRRLQEKIKKVPGATNGLQGASGPTQTTAPGPKVENAVSSRKRKAPEPNEESESDDEVEQKKVKAGEETAVTSKRQTRGKKLDLKEMLGSSSSGVDTGTSRYEDSGVKEEDDDSDGEAEESTYKENEIKEEKDGSDDEVPAATPNKPLSKTANKPITPPKSGSHSSQENPKPTTSAATPSRHQRPVPPPLTPVSPAIVQSIESDDHVEAGTGLDGMQDPTFVRPKSSSSRRSDRSMQSDEMYDAESEGRSTSAASSVQAQAPAETNFLDEDDIESVAPDDSISMVGGGLKRKRAANRKSRVVS